MRQLGIVLVRQQRCIVWQTEAILRVDCLLPASVKLVEQDIEVEDLGDGQAVAYRIAE
jgi:hypothetical protein